MGLVYKFIQKSFFALHDPEFDVIGITRGVFIFRLFLYTFLLQLMSLQTIKGSFYEFLL